MLALNLSWQRITFRKRRFSTPIFGMSTPIFGILTSTFNIASSTKMLPYSYWSIYQNCIHNKQQYGCTNIPVFYTQVNVSWTATGQARARLGKARQGIGQDFSGQDFWNLFMHCSPFSGQSEDMDIHNHILKWKVLSCTPSTTTVVDFGCNRFRHQLLLMKGC